MKNQDLTISFSVNQTPQQVFDAINNVRGWWSAKLEGDSHKVGDEFTYRHGDIHYSKHRVTELIPGKKVVWLTLDARLTFIDQMDEWNGTEVVFNISEKDGKTQLEFVHRGLTPEMQCFKGCSGGWGHYAGESLRSLIETGKGTPDQIEG